MDGIESKRRNLPVPENLRLFKEMKNYTEEVSPTDTHVNIRVEITVFERKSQWITRTKLFVIQ
jgi:hypothetical protein